MITIPPGTYNFDFNCLLPEFAPTSLEKPNGSIRYSATVHFKRSLWPDKVYPVTFTVLKPYNLNDEPHLKVRIFAVEIKLIYKLLFNFVLNIYYYRILSIKLNQFISVVFYS